MKKEEFEIVWTAEVEYLDHTDIRLLVARSSEIQSVMDRLQDRPGVVGTSAPRPATREEVRLNRARIPGRLVPAAIRYLNSL